MESVVVDASVALSWVLPGEDDRRVIELRNRAVQQPGMTLLVPPIFWYEVANALWVAVRRQRIPSGIAEEALGVLLDFLFEESDLDILDCLSTALQQDVSAYDAAYLQVARGAGSLLWTTDRRLAMAGEQLGIETEPHKPA
jgi:predicted nucleic acid-binding protein